MVYKLKETKQSGCGGGISLNTIHVMFSFPFVNRREKQNAYTQTKLECNP